MNALLLALALVVTGDWVSPEFVNARVTVYGEWEGCTVRLTRKVTDDAWHSDAFPATCVASSCDPERRMLWTSDFDLALRRQGWTRRLEFEGCSPETKLSVRIIEQ